MKHKRIIRALFILLISVILSTFLFADAAFVIFLPGGNVKSVKNGSVVMNDEDINIRLKRDGIEVKVEYTFVNTGSATKVTMGFPNSKGRNEAGEMEYGIKDFKAFEGTSPISVFKMDGDAEAKYGIKPTYECFNVSFGKGETKRITNTYTQAYMRGNSDDEIRAEYILKTGASWKGKIGSIKVTIISEIPEHEFQKKSAYFIDGDEIFKKDFDLNITPGSFSRKGNVYTMKFTNIEPDFNIGILRPPLFIKDAYATSELQSGSGKYKPLNMLDDDPATVWVEGKKGSGINETVSFYTNPFLDNNAGAYKVSKIGIINGYAKNASLFKKNNRVKKIRVDYESYLDREKGSVVFTLQDTMKMQYIVFKKPVFMSSFKLTILDVYKGTKWDDTCIAEVRIVPAD